MQLPKSYDPTSLEPALYEWWESHGLFHADAGDDGEPYAIVIPPPNVTGSLHVGHALDNTLQDVLIRRARMQGRNAVWLPGTDHAGIATQTVVEKQLAAEGLTRHDLGREAFIEKVWEWRSTSGGMILQQLRRLGASCDWQREAFTFDEARSAAVRRVFCDLYEAGLIYRGNRLINWDPKARTALSDIEVEHELVQGRLTHFRYPGVDGSDGVVVATTRPETMLGDTAVAVHPDDDRYRDLIGTSVRVPLVDREIPIIADDHVDAEFGTGAVKVTPAHDPNDYEIGLRHNLPMIDVMDDGGAINANGRPYEGLDRFEAREKVVADLDGLGLLVADEPYEHSIGHSERSKVPIEPRLSEQWFVRMQPLAEPAIEAVRDGRTTFIPERNTKGFLRWLENLHDWCISRQIWWGHRIPAWYDAEGGIHVLREDPSEEQIAELGLVRQDGDVLDTWFSSQLWPFTTLGWPEDSPELATWFPTSVLVTGYDINTFWVSRMLMISLFVHNEVPFRTVLNHGLVRDANGKKMSKSFGNVIDPMVLMRTHGADALRYALLRAAPPGQDVPLAEEWVEGGRRFANKLWNVARLVMDRAGEDVTPADGLPAEDQLRLEDRWILSRLEVARSDADTAYDGNDIAMVARGLYHFIWDELADWYLELAKLREDAASKQVLVAVLDVALRLLHPVMPFVTETIWRALHGLTPEDVDTALMRAAWPIGLRAADGDAEAQFAVVQEVVTELRKLRAGYQLAPARRIEVAAVCDGTVRAALQAGQDGIERLAGISRLTFVDQAPQGLFAQVLAAGAELHVSLVGIVDHDAELQRRKAELTDARAELARAEGKLANQKFVVNAPDLLVAAERQKVAHWGDVIDQLTKQMDGTDG
ncbi:MAG TPA: valine--tRNA ligase [Euzebya sp.]|nr:valine--tRNA ligase [Euzebya sp.]